MRAVTLLTAAGVAVALSGCGQSGAAGGGMDPERVARLVAELPAPYDTGDPNRGRSVFALCSACHTVAEGGANMVGPNLHGLFGAKAAAKPGFSYSEPLKASGWTWTPEQLDHWIAEPQRLLPGTKMVFVGVKDAKQRADLVAYLKVATAPAD